LHEGAVDVAEAEETEVVGGDGFSLRGLKPFDFFAANAALKRRSSTVLNAALPRF